MATIREDLKDEVGLGTLYNSLLANYNVDTHYCVAPSPVSDARPESAMDLSEYLDPTGAIATAWATFLNGASRGIQDEARNAMDVIRFVAGGDTTITPDEYDAALERAGADRMSAYIQMIRTQVAIWDYLKGPDTAPVPTYPEVTACNATLQTCRSAVETARNEGSGNAPVWAALGAAGGLLLGAVLVGVGMRRAQVKADTARTRAGVTEAGVAALRGELGTATTRATTAEGRIPSLEQRATTAEGRVTTLEGDLATAQGNATAAEGRVAAAERDLAAARERGARLEGRLEEVGRTASRARGTAGLRRVREALREPIEEPAAAGAESPPPPPVGPDAAFDAAFPEGGGGPGPR